jgi:hypothetical protein
LDRNVSRCTRNIYATCLDFYAKWIMRVKSSFRYQPTHTTRSCGYLNLLVL